MLPKITLESLCWYFETF